MRRSLPGRHQQAFSSDTYARPLAGSAAALGVSLCGCGMGCQRKEQQQSWKPAPGLLRVFPRCSGCSLGDVLTPSRMELCAAGGVSRTGTKTWLRGSLLPSQAAVGNTWAAELLVPLRAAAEQWLVGCVQTSRPAQISNKGVNTLD